MQERSFEGRRGERGFALVLAILSLMLLTFLGLTMAATTSTELQIATNYRWSQQALYNAEAGLEAARLILARGVDATTQWSTRLPAARTAAWTPALPGAAAGPIDGRDYERWECDDRGAGMGYGVVLEDDAQRYENVSAFLGQSLNGAFTIWIRRALLAGDAGTYTDVLDNNKLIVVAEGVAPFAYQDPFTGAPSALVRSRQAVRVLETRYQLGGGSLSVPCGSLAGQEGGSPMGENFNPCANVSGAALASEFGAGITSFTDVK